MKINLEIGSKTAQTFAPGKFEAEIVSESEISPACQTPCLLLSYSLSLLKPIPGKHRGRLTNTSVSKHNNCSSLT